MLSRRFTGEHPRQTHKIYNPGLSKSVTHLHSHIESNIHRQKAQSHDELASTAESNERYYNAKSYEDVTGFGNQYRRDFSPDSSHSSHHNQEDHLNCTAGSQDSRDSYGSNDHYPKRHFQTLQEQDELDVSLEHETRGLRKSRRDYHVNGDVQSLQSEKNYHRTAKNNSQCPPNFSRSTPDLQQLNFTEGTQDKNHGGLKLQVYGDIDFSEGNNGSANGKSEVSVPKSVQRSKSVPRCISTETASDGGSVTVRNKEGKTLADCTTPIKTARLRNIRQKTRNAVVNLMEDGYVCLEFLKHKDGKERVHEVFRISPDGNTVSIMILKDIII